VFVHGRDWQFAGPLQLCRAAAVCPATIIPMCNMRVWGMERKPLILRTILPPTMVITAGYVSDGGFVHG